MKEEDRRFIFRNWCRCHFGYGERVETRSESGGSVHVVCDGWLLRWG